MVAIVLILAGTLTAAANRAQVGVKGVGCLSNLRQWGLATQHYVIDNSDLLPPDGAPNGISKDAAWYVDLPLAIGALPYPRAGSWRTNPSAVLPKSLWICPANRRRSNGNLLFHYVLNRRINGSGSETHSVALASLPAPAETPWLFDNGRLAAVATEGNVHTNAHGSGANFLFLDGHAQRFPNTLYWNFRRSRPITNTPSLRWFP